MREAPSSPETPARLRAVAFALHPGVGPVLFRNQVERFGSAERAFDATIGIAERESVLVDAARALDEAHARGARLLLLEDAEYPAALRELHDPPPFLFVRGTAGALAAPVVAIVGTRRATPYGERVTRELATCLASAGVCVVSGLARGIDGVAHRSALDARGRTAAVLGTGIDVAYPVAHRELQRRIGAVGLLLSEWTCGTRPTPGSFPRRNRIIAALASVTIVVEAGAKSGALITAGHALDLGRTVAAVPGPIDAPQSAGSNELLRDGAVVICTADDALALFGISRCTRSVPSIVGDERLLWDALESGALTVDALAAVTGLTPRACLAAVTALEIGGLVGVRVTGEVARTRA